MEAVKGGLKDKLAKLMTLAAQRRNTLDYQEIMEVLGDDSLSADSIDKTFQVLEAAGVEIQSELDGDTLLLPDGSVYSGGESFVFTDITDFSACLWYNKSIIDKR